MEVISKEIDMEFWSRFARFWKAKEAPQKGRGIDIFVPAISTVDRNPLMSEQHIMDEMGDMDDDDIWDHFIKKKG